MWQDRTDRMEVMWQLLVVCSLENTVITRVALVANGMRARGPIHGHHVYLVGWSILLCKIVCGSSWGSTPGPPPLYKPYQISAYHYTTVFFLKCMRGLIYLNLHICVSGKGGGSGPSPDPWFY
jgi:hypothetical protein